MKDKHIYLLVILVWTSFIGFLSCMEDKELNELQKEKTKLEIKKLQDTVVTFPPDTLVYPSGATGSLRFDWETGEKGKLIEK